MNSKYDSTREVFFGRSAPVLVAERRRNLQKRRRSSTCKSDMAKTKVSPDKLSFMKLNSQKIHNTDSNAAEPSYLTQKNTGNSYESSSSTGKECQNLLAAPSASTTSFELLISSCDMDSSLPIGTSRERSLKNLESTNAMGEIHYEPSNYSQISPSPVKYMNTCHSSHLSMSGSHSETDSAGASVQLIKKCSRRKLDRILEKDAMRKTNLCPLQLPHTNYKSFKSKTSTGGARRRRRHAVGLICGVCGDSARSLHFGGVSCDSCKAFFRRAVIARAYPSFLCVTTGLPPRITCQKSVAGCNQSELYSGNQQETEKYSKDSSQLDSSPLSVQKEMQLGSNSGPPALSSRSYSKFDGEGIKQSYQGTSICSIPNCVPTEVDDRCAEGGNIQSSLSSHQSDVADETMSSSKNVNLHGKCSSFSDVDIKHKTDPSHSKGLESRSVSQKLMKCPPISIANRKYCQACRFQCCIDIGMEVGWVTLENDTQKKICTQAVKSDLPQKDSKDCSNLYLELGESKTKDSIGVMDENSERKEETENSDVDEYLTKEEQQQIEDLVDIYRSVFWGVPEPAYYRPALIDFPPPFETNRTCNFVDESQENIQPKNDLKPTGGKSHTTPVTMLNSEQPVPVFTPKSLSEARTQPSSSSNNLQKEDVISCHISQQKSQVHRNSGIHDTKKHGDILGQIHKDWSNQHSSNDGEPSIHSSYSGELDINYLSDSHNSKEEVECLKSGMSAEEICNLPEDPLGVNMFRKVLIRRPRPWLIRQLMGYTLRFLYVVLKLLHRVGKNMSMADRTILLRQGMTGLTFLNSVFTYDTSVEGWPERVFPSLPLVLQEGDSGSASDQPDYLEGTPMHADEVASVVAADVLEHQLVFIRGMKTLVGADSTTLFLLMAIMLFDPTYEGLQQPQTVEDIQGKYCYLLKQYVSWKFKNGSPTNPGNDRPFNFTPLAYLLQSTNKPGSTRTMGEQAHDSMAAEIENSSIAAGTKAGLLSQNTSGTSPVAEENKFNKKGFGETYSFQFEMREGMYFSPPYPPSPISPSSIYPILLTRMADLKQIAHSYSSTPFLLQGSEVDEIANLVTRIEVFMSDIIATDPEPDFRDKDGSGGEGGTGGGNETQNDDEITHNKSLLEKHSSNQEFERDKNAKKNGDHVSQRKNMPLENCNVKWRGSLQQHFEWDCCSSGEESDNESSLSAMSIGGSFDDIIGALEAGESEEIGNRVGRSSEEAFESMCTWEKGQPMKVVDMDQFSIASEGKSSKISAVEAGSPFEELEHCYMSPQKSNTGHFGIENASAVGLNTNVYCKPFDSDFKEHKELEFKGLCVGPCDPKSNYDRNIWKGVFDGDGSLGSLFIDTSPQKMGMDCWETECQNTQTNAVTKLAHRHDQDNEIGRSLHGNETHLREECSITPLRPNTSELSGEGRMSLMDKKYVHSDGIMVRKSFQIPFSGKKDSSVWQNKETSQAMQQQSLWDRIKKTGKALLGLDSTQTHIQDSSSLWKGVDSRTEDNVLQEDKRDVDYLLNPLERPGSNSSGYSSNVSSPPLLSVHKDFDVYNYGDEWEDLFQKL